MAIRRILPRPFRRDPTPRQPQQGRSRTNRDIYGLSRWTKCSRMHRSKHPLCVECLKKGILTDCSPGKKTGVTDHIQPINQGGDPWDPENWQTLCNSCHNAKSGKEK
ncbi:HNH endonuclease signature motif containing protein [Larkinella humicola]|uniref:HNH endonuclease n=1 Tax=Larkinella humicola TaxID=2607654 RepID=A0A5N1JM54_9BACT|nr:HNH endonuclease signature motif containing protein [Larkinella humicola]KAA9357221.1 HNH endonuclease [Larkinella humicola]